MLPRGCVTLLLNSRVDREDDRPAPTRFSLASTTEEHENEMFKWRIDESEGGPDRLSDYETHGGPIELSTAEENCKPTANASPLKGLQ